MRIDGLQAGRAVAALMVVIFHANVHVLPDKIYAGEASARGFNIGYAGVDFFFVLSGFIMVYIHRRDFGRPERVGTFLRKRVVRIYPICWIVIAILLALSFAAGSEGVERARDPEAILTSLLLVPMPYHPILAVAWTLSHEMLFYLVFAILLINIRLGIAVFAVWMTGCVVGLFDEGVGYPLNFLLSPHNILFLFGIGAAYISPRVGSGVARAALLVGAVVFLGVGFSEVVFGVGWDPGLRTLAYGLGATGVVVGLASGHVPVPRWLSFLGDASYSIYLVHTIAMAVFAVLLKALGAPWGLSPLPMLVVFVALGTLSGAALHVLIEKPVLGWLTPARSPLRGGT